MRRIYVLFADQTVPRDKACRSSSRRWPRHRCRGVRSPMHARYAVLSLCGRRAKSEGNRRGVFFGGQRRGTTTTGEVNMWRIYRTGVKHRAGGSG